MRFLFLLQNSLVIENEVSGTACVSHSVEPYRILVLRALSKHLMNEASQQPLWPSCFSKWGIGTRRYIGLMTRVHLLPYGQAFDAWIVSCFAG